MYVTDRRDLIFKFITEKTHKQVKFVNEDDNFINFRIGNNNIQQLDKSRIYSMDNIQLMNEAISQIKIMY